MKDRKEKAHSMKTGNNSYVIRGGSAISLDGAESKLAVTQGSAGLPLKNTLSTALGDHDC